MRGFNSIERIQNYFIARNRQRALATGKDVRSVTDSTSNQDLVAGFVGKAAAAVATFPVQKGQAMVQGSNQFPTMLCVGRAPPRRDARRPQQRGLKIDGVNCSVRMPDRSPAPHGRSALKENIREGGIVGMYTGVIPKLMQAALQQSLIFRFKEQWTPGLIAWTRRFYWRNSVRARLGRSRAP